MVDFVRAGQALPPTLPRAGNLATLQQRAGNRAVNRLIDSGTSAQPPAHSRRLAGPIVSLSVDAHPIGRQVIQRTLTIRQVPGRPGPVVLNDLPDSTQLSLAQNFQASPQAIQILDQWARVDDRTFDTWQAAVAEANMEAQRRSQGDFGHRNAAGRFGGLPPDSRVITAEDFEAMPEAGTINPYRVRIAQGGIEQTFRDGRKLSDTVSQLAEDPDVTNQIPPVNIGLHLGHIWAFDTRRVIAHQMAREQNANVVMRYRKISAEERQERIDSIYTGRPYMGLVTSVRYHGKKSGSTPYINPAYRALIQDEVLGSWLYDDYEGFPELSEKEAPAPLDDKFGQAQKVIEADGKEGHNEKLKRIVKNLKKAFPELDVSTVLAQLKKLYMLNLMAGVDDIIAQTFEDVQFYVHTKGV